MSRYQVANGVEAEHEPGSRKRVLRNLLGIGRKIEIDAVEYEALVTAQKAYYRQVDKNTVIDARFIRAMHRDWLGGIYEWAGNYRTVDVEKLGFRWPPAYLIARNMERFESQVLAEYTPCHGRDLAEVCNALARVHAELLLIHPFREGNGRIARWLADLMAAQADYPPPLYRFRGRGSTRVRNQYLTAVTSGYKRDYEDLARFFEEAISLRLRS